MNKLRKLIREAVGDALDTDLTQSWEVLKYPYECGCGEQWKSVDSALACKGCMARIEQGQESPVIDLRTGERVD